MRQGIIEKGGWSFIERAHWREDDRFLLNNDIKIGHKEKEILLKTKTEPKTMTLATLRQKWQPSYRREKRKKKNVDPQGVKPSACGNLIAMGGRYIARQLGQHGPWVDISSWKLYLAPLKLHSSFASSGPSHWSPYHINSHPSRASTRGSDGRFDKRSVGR